MSLISRTLRVVCCTAVIAAVTVGVPASPAWATATCFTVTDNVVSAGGLCTGVVTLPDGVTSIGGSAFENSGLTSIEIPNTVTSIGSLAFRNSGLTSIEIPKSVTLIDNAFNNTTALKSVTFEAESALRTISNGAFYGSGLTSIVIPKSVTSIGVNAFNYTRSLKSVTFEPGSEIATMEDSNAFRDSTLESIVIPKSVTYIGNYAFYGTIPSKLVVTFEGNAPQVGREVFHPGGATAIISSTAGGFSEPNWNGLVVVRASVPLVPVFGAPVRTADGFTVEVTNFAGDFTWAAVVDGGSVVVGDASGATLPLTVTGVAPGVEVTVTVTTQRAVYDSGSATVTGSALERVVAVAGAPSVTCSPLPAQVGALVTCTVTGGDAGSEILWRAAFNPAFASEGVTLDASGSGQFTFVVPAGALGEVLTVELVGWTAPVSLGVSSGPVPTSVPSGGGPVPVWPAGLLALAGVLVLRSASRAPRLMPSVREG